MDLSAYELALIAGGFGIAGTLLGAAVAYWLSLKLADRQFEHMRAISKEDAWHLATREFRAAFVDELAIIESNDEIPIGLDEYLKRAYYAKHRIAITVFELSVPASKRARFMAVCGEYHSSQPTREKIETGVHPNDAMFVEYTGHPYRHPTHTPRQLASERIRTMLGFARLE